ncbi:twitching motility protein PilT [Pseudomonas sp. A46]|nr:type II toxin-antitoxin system VapC family toxin [Pseudomonas sp. A46]OWJ92517.1 twitching motility protein PilT [Pseudomonas sp. A46]
MRVLLDTHILLWALTDSPKLSPRARRHIEEAAEVYVSAASFWEMSIKAGLGKLDIDLEAVRNGCRTSGFTEIPIAVEHCLATRDLPHHHRDPFDRILVATAVTEPMRLLTADPLVVKYTELAVLV